MVNNYSVGLCTILHEKIMPWPPNCRPDGLGPNHTGGPTGRPFLAHRARCQVVQGWIYFKLYRKLIDATLRIDSIGAQAGCPAPGGPSLQNGQKKSQACLTQCLTLLSLSLFISHSTGCGRKYVCGLRPGHDLMARPPQPPPFSKFS
jgi:hypothetical protein